MGDKDFFLSPDDAMTMGDINYMRTSKRTRRTFPKTLKNKDGFAFENEVSSIEDRSGAYKANNTNQNSSNQNSSVNTVFNPTPSSQSQPGITGGSAVTQTESSAVNTPVNTNIEQPAPSFESSSDRRKQDTSMDMFRNMAKNIRR